MVLRKQNMVNPNRWQALYRTSANLKLILLPVRASLNDRFRRPHDDIVKDNRSMSVGFIELIRMSVYYFKLWSRIKTCYVGCICGKAYKGGIGRLLGGRMPAGRRAHQKELGKERHR